LNLKYLIYEARRRQPDYSNLRELAMRSLELVSDYTSDLDRTWAPFVHTEVDLYQGLFAPHMGWSGGEVACFRSETTSPTGASVFLALFGSASNLVGYRRNDEALRGFHPSDMAGLYALLDSVREPGDPEIDLRYRIDDHTLDRSAIVAESIDFARGGACFEPRRLELLARVLVSEDEYARHEDRFDQVIVAAPLWIRTPLPQPSPDGVPPTR
jgi:hypothetical protein